MVCLEIHAPQAIPVRFIRLANKPHQNSRFTNIERHIVTDIKVTVHFGFRFSVFDFSFSMFTFEVMVIAVGEENV